MEAERIETLEVLRALAFLGVFCSHIGFNAFISTGRWGVSVFFILTGFLLTYRYYGKGRITKDCGIKNNFGFLVRKIKRLFPLHIITTLFMFIFVIIGNQKEPLLKSIVELMANLFLIHTWFPILLKSVNPVSWYLSTLIPMYFLFPWILRYMEKTYSRNKAISMIAIAIFIQTLIGILGMHFPSIDIGGFVISRDGIAMEFINFFPLSRMWDILIGCNLGYLYLHQEREYSERSSTVWEGFVILLAIIGNILGYIFNGKYVLGGMTDMVPIDKNWWTLVLVYTVSSCMLVYFFAIGKGKVSKVLTRKVLLYIAKLSPYAFLIHMVVFRYLSFIYYHIPTVDGEKFAFYYGRWISLTLGFVITIICSEIWMRLTLKGNLKLR